MREGMLIEFLVGRVGSSALRRALGETEEGRAPEPPPAPLHEFELLPLHLLRLCDAVLDRELDAALLGPIASRLAAAASLRGSPRDPDARIVREVLDAWMRSARPNLDVETVRVHRRWIVARRDPFGEG